MGQFLRYCLLSEREAFLADLRPKYILPSLIGDGIINEAEREEILKEEKYKYQVLRLIEILPKKGPKVFECFVKALQEGGSYPWLAEKLLEKKKSDNYGSEIEIAEDLHKELVAGGVPFQTNHFFKREKLMLDIHKALKVAVTKKRHWVVLHGMMGCGKSVLAAEAIRDKDIFKECFSSGVCWIPIGNVKTAVILKLKMQTLCERLENGSTWHFNDQDSVDTNDSATIKMKKKFREVLTDEKYGKFLIVLDDVWEHKVIEAFDVYCPIIVTTRDKSIFEKVDGFCTFIDVGDSQYQLKPADTRRFLAPYVKVDPSELPMNEISAIHYRCKGLPLMLSLIGGSMSRWGNKLERWKRLGKNLDRGITEAFSGSHNSTEYITDILSMIDLIIESLDEGLRDYYFDLVVFEEDVFIRTKVLEVMWKMNKIEVEDIMCELNQKSLVLFEEDPNSDSYRYSVHNLYLGFLQRRCKDIEQACHKKLVNNYLDLCKTGSRTFNYGLFPDDGYIHLYIGQHLVKADMVEYFPEIYLDLNFIQNKLRFSGPGDLLYDLDAYKSYFIEEINIVNDIDAFIRKNAHLISQKDSDIIQLALFEPETSRVHKNARKAALANSEKVYFEWRNQENVPYRSVLNVKLDFQTHYALFSPNNVFVAAVGEDNSVLIWDSASGKELDRYSEHTGAINYCAFNADGSMLCTASKDMTVKLWEINYGLLSDRRSSKTKRLSESNLPAYGFRLNDSFIPTFKYHKAEVNYCSFSPDGSLIISGDESGATYVWEINSGNVKYSRPQVSESANVYPVTCCMFLSKNVVAIAIYATIYIWDLMSGKENVLSHDDVIVTSFCCTPNGEYIFSTCGSYIWKWNVKCFGKVESFKESQSYTICCCCLSPTEKFIAAGTSDCSVIVWNIASRKAVVNLKGHGHCVKSVSYSDDGNQLLSASEDGHIIIWNMQECNATSMLSLQSNLSVQWCESNLMIASSDDLNCIQVRCGPRGQVKYKSTPDTSEITACLLLQNCAEVVYGTKSGAINMFDMKSNRTIMCEPHRGKVNFLVEMKYSEKFVSCSEDSTIKIWDKDKKCIVYRGHFKSVVKCVLYNCDTMMISCSEDGTLRVWDIKNIKTTMILEGHGNQNVTCCDISPCCKWLCSSSTDKTIKIWDATNGRELRTYFCKESVRCCYFSPVPGFLLSGEDSGLVTMWDMNNKNDLGKPLGFHDTWVTDLKFREDGLQFASVSDSIKLWTGDGRLAQTIILPGAFPCVLCTSSDFKQFILVHNSLLYILECIS